MLTSLFAAAFALSATPSTAPDSQHYALQTSTSATLIEVVVPFQKVIAMQSYILRVCPVSSPLFNVTLSAKLDGVTGSAYAMSNGCMLIDWSISLTQGEHSVTIVAGSGDTATYHFNVVEGSREEFGTVSSGRYTDWSLLRSKNTVAGDFTLCSLSLAEPKDAVLVQQNQGNVSGVATISKRTDDSACYDISGAFLASDALYELHIRLSSGRSIVFPIENSNR